MDNGESSLRRYMGGDNEAFGEIVETYYRGLVMFAMRYVGDEPEAENIASDALFELMIKPERYKFRSSLKSTISSNLALIKDGSRPKTAPLR